MVTEDNTLGDVTEGGTGVATAKPNEAPAELVVEEQRKALVKQWLTDVKDAEAHWESKAFKRMRVCMKLAADGTTIAADAEAENGNYVVPIINRIVNQGVATLYAKNPTAVAKRKPKLLYRVWDGDPLSIQAAMMAVQQPSMVPVTDPATGQPVADPATGGPMLQPQADPTALAILKEVQDAKTQIILYDRMGKTMQLGFKYYLEEQDAGYKEQFKALVRRVKTCAVGYVELDFQRLMKQNPDVAAKISDVSSKIASIEALVAQAKAGELEVESAELETLRLNMQDLQNQLEVIAREGPILSFPRATEVFPDKDCRDLKTWAGSNWIVRRYDMTPAKIAKVYKKDVKGNYTPYKNNKAQATGEKGGCCRVYRVQDKENQQVFVVCDGYPDFLVEPATPDVDIERFWTIYALVFNGIESEDNPFPPSDVWNARHMQREYNSSRQGLREHKQAARPRWGSQAGKLDETDKQKLKDSVPFEVIEFKSIAPGEKVADLLDVIPVPGVDPNLYETETTFGDIQRTVGFQEANLGGTSGDTATESSIAENSRSAAAGSDVDDLDTMLSALARGLGQVMLMNVSKETMIEIAGPGAVWPDAPPTREQVVKDLFLEIEAGSSGRPNKAAELANYERAMPWVTQLPGMNPKPWAKKALELFDFDLEENYVEGLPSMAAMNQMSSKPPATSEDPNAQGGQGAAGASGKSDSTQTNEPQSQPEYTPPSDGMAPAGG